MHVETPKDSEGELIPECRLAGEEVASPPDDFCVSGGAQVGRYK